MSDEGDDYDIHDSFRSEDDIKEGDHYYLFVDPDSLQYYRVSPDMSDAIFLAVNADS